MAPEQALGEPLGPATDIYALGVTLYHFLSGRLPFSGEADSPAAILYQRVHEDSVPLAEAAPHVPGPIAGVVMRALAKRPEERYDEAEAFGVALAEAAGEAFGAGWMERSEAKLAVGGPIAAAAERRAGRPTESGERVMATGDRYSFPSPHTPPPVEELVEVTKLPVPVQLLSARASMDRAGGPTGEVDAVPEPEVPEPGEPEPEPGEPGGSAAARLGLPENATADELRRAALDAVAHWRRRAESPLTSRAATEEAEAEVRSCEEILAELDRAS
jgi:hypothetical protein